MKMHCSGVCHTDLHASLGDWPLQHMTPLIGGHEGVGEIVAIGKNTIKSPVKIGQRVGIKWIADSCFNCEQCRKGYEQSEYLKTLPIININYVIDCENVKLSGFTVDGTFQQYLVRLCSLAFFLHYLHVLTLGILCPFCHCHSGQS